MYEKRAGSMQWQIKTIYWDMLPVELIPPAIEWREVFMALWPGPIDADQCFIEAGFTELYEAENEEAEDAWESEWRELVATVIEQLSVVGDVRPRAAVEVLRVEEGSWLRRLFGASSLRSPPLELSLLDQILLVSNDSHFGAITVDFGEPPQASLRAGEGHPLLWLSFDRGAIDSQRLVEQAAAGRPVKQLSLNWERLMWHRG